MRIFFYMMAALLIAAPSWADEARGYTQGHGYEYEDDHDHDRARRALEKGEILALSEILKKSEQNYAGHLIEAELDDEHGKLVYKLVVLTANGRVLKLYYDARSGDLLELKERSKDH